MKTLAVATVVNLALSVAGFLTALIGPAFSGLAGFLMVSIGLMVGLFCLAYAFNLVLHDLENE